MIISPSDVSVFRELARNVIHKWNSTYAISLSTVLIDTGWETHTAPTLNKKHPQTIINEHVLKYADIAIAIFWSRIGTATKKYQSGSLEEIHKHVDNGKPLLLYFFNAPIPKNNIDADQLNELNSFKEWAKNNGLYAEFNTESEFSEILIKHLYFIINNHPFINTKINQTKITDSDLIIKILKLKNEIESSGNK